MAGMSPKAKVTIWVIALIVIAIIAWIFFQSYIPTTRVQRPEPIPQPAMVVGGAAATPSPISFMQRKLAVSESATAQQFVVKTGSIVMTVHAFAPVVTKVRALVAQANGLVVSSNVTHAEPSNSYYAQRSSATMVVRVPAKALESMMTAIQHMAVQVINVSTNAQNITRRMIDNQAKLTNLEHTVKVLSGLMDQSKKMSDTVTIYSKISSLNSQIEVLKATIAHDKQQVALSTLRINLQLPNSLETHVSSTQSLSWGATFKRAWITLENNCKGLIIFLVNFLVGFLPIFIVILIVLGVIVWFVKRLWKRK